MINPVVLLAFYPKTPPACLKESRKEDGGWSPQSVLADAPIDTLQRAVM